jgi:hypothetical protein
MKEQRLFAVIITLFGLVSIANAVLGGYGAHTLQVFGATRPLKPGQLEMARTISHDLVLAATLHAMVGAVALCAAYGIIRNRKWPLRLWLAVVSLGAGLSVIAREPRCARCLTTHSSDP